VGVLLSVEAGVLLAGALLGVLLGEGAVPQPVSKTDNIIATTRKTLSSFKDFFMVTFFPPQ